MVSFGSVDRLTMAAWFLLVLMVVLAFVFPDKCYVSTLTWSISGLGALSSVGSYAPVPSCVSFLLLETEYFKKCTVSMLSAALWLDLILSFPCLITRQLFSGPFFHFPQHEAAQAQQVPFSCAQLPDDSSFAGACLSLFSDLTKLLNCVKWQLAALLFSVLFLEDKYHLSNPIKLWFVCKNVFSD